MTAKEDAPL